jgi:hypothetical protein
VKKALTIVGAVAVLAAMLSFVAAGASKREQATEADALPAYEIVTTVRSMGLNPISEPARRGPYYVLRAYDPRGIEVRVVADAQFGDILSIASARALNTAYAPNYQRAPRIIHVPQADERDDRANDRASVNERDQPAASNDDDEEEAASPPRRRVTPPPPPRTTPRWQPRSDAPPSPGPRRTVLSAPPPPAEGPTPIRPIPRYNSKADPADKFAPPRDVTSSAPSPPVGYSPPAALPQRD